MRHGSAAMKEQRPHGFPRLQLLARGLAARKPLGCISGMKLILENLPPSLLDQAEAIGKCLEAFNRVMPVRAVYLFGSHARGDARPDSDVDLCLVSEGAARFRRAARDVLPKPAFTLVPITPNRLREKQQTGDHFFQTVLRQGIWLAS